MKMNVIFALILAFLGVGTAHAASTISGTVKFEGTAPGKMKIDVSSDPICSQANPGGMFSNVFELGAGQTVANVFVKVKNPPKKTFTPSTEGAVLDQKGCQYHPRVVGVMVGQPLKVLNSDKTMHNVHAKATQNREFNMAMPQGTKEMVKRFMKPEHVVMKCDVHSWMEAHVMVTDHPFFAVTKSDGKFSITGLDPGEYEIEVWHEKFPVQTAKVTVGANETKTQDFTFKK